MKRRSFLWLLACAVIPARYLWPYLREQARCRREAEAMIKATFTDIWGRHGSALLVKDECPLYFSKFIQGEPLTGMLQWSEVGSVDVWCSDFGMHT